VEAISTSSFASRKKTWRGFSRRLHQLCVQQNGSPNPVLDNLPPLIEKGGCLALSAKRLTLGARDFVDVQSFIWVTCGGYDQVPNAKHTKA